MADDEPLIDEALAVADRRPVVSTSDSHGICLLDRLARLFGASPSETPEPGVAALFLWGPLEVRKHLGSGTFGDVYEAWDPTLHRVVALKLRSPESGALRWLDEARNLARIRHPNVLTVYGADVLDGRAGIWTERIVGGTLEEAPGEAGALAEAEVVRIGRDVASALSAVHAAGLVHGDVKPANIMLEAGDGPRRVVLVDFGSADRAAAAGDAPAFVMGTPLTMAPEVLSGGAPSASSDVYGLGATLFRLHTNHYPVEAPSIEALRRMHVAGERARMRDLAPNASARLARAVERAVEPDPALRWPDAKSLERALVDIADPTRRIRMRATMVGATLALLTAVALVAVWIARPGSGPISSSRLPAPRAKGILTQAWQRPGSGGAQSGYGYRAIADDIDGDGFADLIAAESRWRPSPAGAQGRLLVFRGSATGVDTTAAHTLAATDTVWVLAAQIAVAGDVNGDGRGDLLVCEERATDWIGRVWLYPGVPAGAPLVPTWSQTGLSRDSGLGRSMMSAGDVNHDGFGDVVIGECRASDQLLEAGIVRLYFGSRDGLAATPAWSVRGEQISMELGSWMNRTGDVNGDGFEDILVGAQLWDGPGGVDYGTARLYLGTATGASPDPVWRFDGAGPNSLCGGYVAGAGDVNGDGFADLLVGEKGYSDARHPKRGRALIFLGGKNGPAPAPDWQVHGHVSYAQCGFFATGVGDIDADGFADVAVSSPSYTEGKRTHLGMVEVFRGGPDGCEKTAAWRVIGPSVDSYLGHQVASGDLNGDGSSDLVVSAPVWGNAVAVRGLVFAYFGHSRPGSARR